MFQTAFLFSGSLKNNISKNENQLSKNLHSVANSKILEYAHSIYFKEKI